MIKVAINGRHGGFRLSQEAFQWLIDNKGWIPYSWETPDEERPLKSIHDMELETGDNREMYDKYPNISHRYSSMDMSYGDKVNELRTHPDVIEVVETLENHSDRVSSIEIIEIPDDVDWQIEEYDGSEWIAEKHRTWR